MADVNLRRRKLVLRAAIFTALALAAGTSVSIESIAGSGPPTPPVPWTHLPPSLRAIVHPAVDQIPRFPGENDSLLDFRHWPRQWIVDGRAYPLTFLDRPNVSFWRRYVAGGAANPTASGDVLAARSYGPEYVWRPDSSLGFRNYSAASGNQHWSYDPQGRVALYQRHSFRTHPKSWLSCGRDRVEEHYLQEWYSESGQLVAFTYDEIAYWNGVRLPYRAYDDSLEAWRVMRNPEWDRRRQGRRGA